MDWSLTGAAGGMQPSWAMVRVVQVEAQLGRSPEPYTRIVWAAEREASSGARRMIVFMVCAGEEGDALVVGMVVVVMV